MLSRQLMQLEKCLALASAGQVTPPPAVLKLALKIATDCRRQAEHMENQVIPQRQRVDAEHLKSGKVTILPIIPRDEAFK